MKTTLLEEIAASPLVWVSLAFLSGIVLSSALPLSTFVWLGMAGALLAVGLVVWRLRPQTRLALLLLPGFLFLGAARYAWVQPVITPNSAAYYNDLERKIYVTGFLSEPPDVRDTYMNLRLVVEAIDLGEGDIPSEGVVLVRLSNDYELEYGDRIRVRGFLQTPPENEEFSYRAYLERQGIHSLLRTDKVTLLPAVGDPNPFWKFLYRVKNSLLYRTYQLFPAPESALMAGVLLGEDNNIPEKLQEAFKNTGTAHIVAISGFNIAIVAAVLVGLFSRFFGKQVGALLAVLGILFYTLLVGADPSVVRAAIMGTLSLLAAQVGRRNLALNTLAVVALMMALWNPYLLWDIGFQLSFLATLGLVLYAQLMQDWAKDLLTRWFPSPTAEKIIGPLSDYFLLTLAAQLTTLPIMAYHFARVSLVSIFANPFILPAQPPVMILGGLAVLAGRLYEPLGQALAWITWPFPAYTIRMVEFFDGFPGGVLVLGDFSLLFTILVYGALFGLTLFWARLGQTRSYLTPSVALTSLIIVASLTWRSAINSPDGRLHVTFLNAGSADSILIQTPDGRFVLINGGSSPSNLADQIGRRIPPFDQKLDLLVVASTQENQVAALPRVLEQYTPERVLWAGNSEASFSAGLLEEWLLAQRVDVVEAYQGDIYSLGRKAMLKVLAVSPRGAVLSVEWGRFRAILPIGVDFDTFDVLKNGEGLGPVTALLLSESGYLPSNPEAWIKTLAPQVVVLSVDASDPNGLPSRELLETLEDANLLRTDVDGWIDFTTDGEDLWLTVERK